MMRKCVGTGAPTDSIDFAHLLLKEALDAKPTQLRFEGSRLTDSDLGTVAARLFQAFNAFVGRYVFGLHMRVSRRAYVCACYPVESLLRTSPRLKNSCSSRAVHALKGVLCWTMRRP
jgi:hypothetical protein